MPFDNDYWHALDKQASRNIEVSSKDIGISHGAGDVLDGLKSNIMTGATHVELGFTGTGKGNLAQGSTTPEMFGRDKRVAIRQLAKLNDTTVSTHASIGVQGMGGVTEHGFSDRAAQASLNEVKRAIDFAAESTEGGPVVVHAAEFPIEISEKYKEFEIYPSEKGVKEEIVNLVDKETGRFMRFQKGQIIDEPEWQKNEEGQFINAFGQPIPRENIAERVPIVNPETGEIKFREKRWADIEKEAMEAKMDPGKFFVMQMHKTEMERAKPFAHSYYRGYKEIEKYCNEVNKRYEALKRLEKGADKRTLEMLRVTTQEEFKPLFGAFHEEFKIEKGELPSEALKEKMKVLMLQAQHQKEGFMGYSKEIERIKKMEKNIVPIQEVGINRSADNLARAGIYAYDRQKSEGLKKPLFISPENLFPETGYGSHPEELKEFVLKSRKAMAERLEKERKMGKAEAERIAKEHIKATFDIGHAHTWKKFFKVRPGESREETERRYRKWMMDQVDKLNKEGILGHVHLADNFGYFDEHLTPGMGDAPMKEFVKKIKEKGFKGKMVAEPGAQSKEELYQAMTGGWREVATSPMYRTRRGVDINWTDIEDSYFGRTRRTSYMAGKYVPSEEYRGVEKGAPFWVGLGLE